MGSRRMSGSRGLLGSATSRESHKWPRNAARVARVLKVVLFAYIYPCIPKNTLLLTFYSYLATQDVFDGLYGWRERVGEWVSERVLVSYPATRRDIPLGALRFNGARMLFEEV